MLQTVRLAMILDNAQGTRKELRVIHELRERMSLTDEDLQALLTPVQNGAVISPRVTEMPGTDLAMTKEEARRVLELLDTQTLTSRDLAWAEPLAKSLAEVIG